MQKELTPQEALSILDQAAATVTANRETHIQLGNASKVLNLFIAENSPKADKKTDSKPGDESNAK